jgi:hypothetical protein
VGPHLQRDLGVPIAVVVGRRVAVPRTADLEHTGQQEVLEAFVGKAKGARVPAEAVERDGVGGNPAPARLRAGQGLVLHLDRLGPADGADDRAKCHWLNAANRRRGGCVGWQVRDPAVLALQHVVGNEAELREVVRGVWRAELAVEVGPANIGARALVVDHVVRRQRDVAIQIRGCLVHRDAELLHHVDAINVPLPEQAELDELEALLNTPAQFRFSVAHVALPDRPERTRTVRTQFLDIPYRREASQSIEKGRV